MLLINKVLKSQDTLKSKIKEDQKAINNYNSSIQAITKSVHKETIYIIDT